MKILKNPTRVAIKMFILVWVVLLLQVVLKLTFNYWQPYVIPNETMKVISDFIDNNQWLEILIDKTLFIINAVIVLWCSVQEWYIKKIYPYVIIVIGAIVSFVDDFTPYNNLIDSIVSIAITFVLPLIVNILKWWCALLTIVFSNLFLLLSLWLEGFVYANDMPYIVKMFLNTDYYIMLVIFYIGINLIKKRK